MRPAWAQPAFGILGSVVALQADQCIMDSTNRPNTSRCARRWGVVFCYLAVAAFGLSWWTGCGSPEKRYKVLSFFFDGVPDPHAPKVAVRPGEAAAAAVGKVRPLVASVHKPFADNNCAACHKGGPESGFELSAINSNVCITCHERVLHEYPIMHAPVSALACMWCHNPHDSPQPALLREPAPAVCTQCHEKDLLGPKTPEHLLKDSKCLDCHLGHGGVKPYQLRSDLPIATALPTTAPSAPPTSAPSPTSAPAPGGSK